MADSRVWFITGATRGLGRAVTEAALAAGDRVVGAARDVGPLADLVERYPDTLVGLPLDVADRSAVTGAVDRSAETYGRLDIVLNNAGGMLLGMLEEATEEQIRRHFDVNFFGAVWVTRAVIPHLRSQGSGRLLQVTSMGSGAGVASVGFYAAGKAALDALSQSVAMELAPFGITVSIVQPGGYDTGLYPADPPRRARPRLPRLGCRAASVTGAEPARWRHRPLAVPGTPRERPAVRAAASAVVGELARNRPPPAKTRP
ncbi:SDR family NAD(P)-dependent oxidoreductase [Micromonospora craniellae]|uniref:SDR family NAD(P)-dependent oxidoreductase n=1 Tax=Micromonospora craniellae TaxID=2294034 RepID=UPI001CC6D0B1|nr:SDR family NAD(P)-dependent oxidoreductase [Micromonospora craniellae]